LDTERLLGLDRTNVKVQKADNCAITYEDASFDTYVAKLSLHLVLDA
jgi:hypothetical protein